MLNLQSFSAFPVFATAPSHSKRVVPHSAVVRYTLIGGLFGLCFPVGATLFEVYLQGLTLSLPVLLEIQSTQPLLWIIDTAPFFLGLVASFAGRKEDKLLARVTQALQAKEELENENRELFLATSSKLNVSEEFIRTIVGEEKLRLSDMLEATPSCFKMVDRSGDLLFMNRQGLDLIEAPDLPSVFGANVYDLVEASHRDTYIDFNQKVCDGSTGTLVFEIVGLDGTRRWMETWAAPHELPDGQTVQVAITNDISERVMAEQRADRQQRELLQAQKLAAVGEFAAGLGHEINNPLAIISGRAGLLIEHCESGQPLDREEVSDDLKAIESTALRIRSIADGLTTLTRQDTDSPMVSVQLDEIVRQTVELCGPLLRSNDVRLDVDVAPGLEVRTNPVQVEQVLMNLISNALHAVKDLDDPWISIHGGLHDEQRVQLRVTDSGHLTDPEVIERMLNPFFTTKEVGEGTGLGLSVSRALMESLDGALTFDPELKNTTFCVDLPESVE